MISNIIAGTIALLLGWAGVSLLRQSIEPKTPNRMLECLIIACKEKSSEMYSCRASEHPSGDITIVATGYFDGESYESSMTLVSDVIDDYNSDFYSDDTRAAEARALVLDVRQAVHSHILMTKVKTL